VGDEHALRLANAPISIEMWGENASLTTASLMVDDEFDAKGYEPAAS
jgi:hypothetical protein